jgi:superfamily II DNA or RNA helicase
MNKGFALRDYQKRFARSVVDGFTVGHAGQGPFTRQLGIAATGAGKSIVASALIYWMRKRALGRSLFLADTDELVQQAREKIYESAGVICDIEKAENKASMDVNVVVGSVQTMGRRHTRFPRDHFKLVIADEAHCSLAKQYRSVLEWFNGGGAWILGITATPERGDGQKLMHYYEHLAAEIGLFELINAGHLAPLTVQVCPIRIDATGIATKKTGINKGEFDANDLEETIEPYWEAIIDEWQQHASDRKTLIFHPSIKASERFTGLMQARGIKAKHVSGVERGRAEIIRGFSKGSTQVLNNAQLLTKGFDVPDISCIINLRPTKSRTQYLQMIGRGTRTAPGKSDALILDFLWQFQELGIMRPSSLLGDDDDQEEAVAQVLADGKRRTLTGASEEAERERELAVISRLRQAADHGAVGRYDARDLAALIHQPDLIHYQPRAKWEKLPITPAQRQILGRHGVDVSTVTGLGHAHKILEALIARRNQGLADTNQLRELLLAGHPDAASLRYSQAKEALKSIA